MDMTRVGLENRIKNLEAQNRDLQTRWEEANEALRAIRGGEVDALVIYTEDGERIYTLEGADHSYREMIENISEGAATLQPDGMILYCNRRLAGMLAVPLETLLGLNLTDFVQTSDLPAFKSLLPRAGEAVGRGEIGLRRGDGAILPALLSMSGVDNNGGLSICLVATDLTEQKRSAVILEAERMARSILEQAAEAIVVCDAKGRIIRASQAAQRMKGEDTLFCHFDQAFPLVFEAPVVDLNPFSIDAVLKGEVYQGVEAMLVQGDGDGGVIGGTLHLMLSACPLRTEEGGILGCTVVLADITQLRRSKQEAIENATQLEVQHRLIDQREKERQQIARDLHDGPVQALAGATFIVQGLLDENPSPEMIEQLESIRETLKEQINELRSFAGELRPPTLSKFGLSKAIVAHIQNFTEKHPDLHIDFEEDIPQGILSEEACLALYRIYQETLNNIAKHAQASRVIVRLEKESDKVMLEIADNGSGFSLPRDWLELVRHGHLGLVGIRERAQAIGAQAEILSKPGNGTQVRVSLPS